MPDLSQDACNAVVKQGSKILICGLPLRHADEQHLDEVTGIRFTVPAWT